MSDSEWHIDEVIVEIDRLVMSRVKRLLQRYQRIVQEAIRSPKSGRVYGGESSISYTTKSGKDVKFTANKGKRLGKGRKGQGVHQASAPGEAPARDTGALAKGIGDNITVEGNVITAEIGVSVESGRGSPVSSDGRSIAEMLEFGTTNMDPRPLWRPALEKLKAEADEILGRKKDDAGD